MDRPNLRCDDRDMGEVYRYGDTWARSVKRSEVEESVTNVVGEKVMRHS